MSDANLEMVRPNEPTKDLARTTRAERVTLFEDRAEVVRRVAFAASKGVRVEACAGVSLLIDDGSVQAKVIRGAARVLSVRVLRRVHLERALGREDIDALERDVRAAKDRLAAANNAIERTQRVLQQHFQLSDQWTKAVSLGPRKGADTAVIASHRDAWRSIDASSKKALDDLARARADHARAERDVALTERRHREAMVEKPRYDAVVELELEAEEACDVEAEICYRVPCALWRPEHLARLVTDKPDAKSGVVELVTYAVVWQSTGEAWDDVEARFSTARPARAALAPRLSDDVLWSRKKTDEERRHIVVAAREQAIDEAGLDRGERAVSEMPGVDDGGEPLHYVGKQRVSLPSNGRPFRVEIGSTRVDAEISRILMATSSPAAHVRATATLVGSGPLLAGPVRLARGTSVVGRSKIDYVGKGEPFELGFGPDDGIRVRRTEDEERDTQVLTGTQRIKRKVTLFLSNLSDIARRVVVCERIPVSEIDEVEIQLLDAGPFKLDHKDGFLRATVDIAAQMGKSFGFTYEVRAGSKVVLPEF